VKELIRLGTLSLSLMTIFTVILPGIGIVLSSSGVAAIVSKLTIEYIRSGKTERKQIRALVSWIKSGFDLGDRLIE
jgi:uncharacterized membrane protein